MNLHAERLKSARVALHAFHELPGHRPDGAESDLTDLVTNLLHLANWYGVDPYQLTQKAFTHFAVEHTEREEAARTHGRSVKGGMLPVTTGVK